MFKSATLFMEKLFQKLSVKQVILIGGLVAGGLLAFWLMPQATAIQAGSSERLITIHDRGQEIGLITKATTLRQAFSEAKIDLDSNDLVEPGLDKALVGKSYQVNVYRARPLVIVDGNTRQLVMSAYQTPRQIAEAAGISLHDQDEAELKVSGNMIRDGASVQMVIDRALAVKLVLYGKKSVVYTQANTVAEFIKDKNIHLKAKDSLAIDKNTQIRDGMKIEIWRNGKQTVTEEESIAFTTRKIQDANQEIGYRKVDTPGAKGTKMVTYQIEMRNGKEISRKEIQVVVTKQPTKQVETVGAKFSNTFDGSFSEALSRLRSCEGSYSSNTGNGYYGAYQYDIGTWGGYKGYPNAAAAPPAVQDQKAWETYQGRGWQPWPSCKNSMGLQDIYR